MPKYLAAALICILLHAPPSLASDQDSASERQKRLEEIRAQRSEARRQIEETEAKLRSLQGNPPRQFAGDSNVVTLRGSIATGDDNLRMLCSSGISGSVKCLQINAPPEMASRFVSGECREIVGVLMTEVPRPLVIDPRLQRVGAIKAMNAYSCDQR